MRVDFDPTNPEDRRSVRRILETFETEDTVPDVSMERLLRKLPKLVRLASGKLIVLAVRHFGPDIAFSMKDLADKSEVDLDTILSKNRTLSYSCEKRGVHKSSILVEHGGAPKRFSVPAAVHAEVTRLWNRSPEGEPAAATA